MKKAGVLLIALGVFSAFLAFNMDVTASHKTGVLNDRQNIIYLSGILFLSGIILFGFGVFDKKDEIRKSDKVFFNSTKMISWIFRIGIFAIVLFLVVVSAIKILQWYNYDRYKEKIDLSISFNTNECSYPRPVHVKIRNNSVLAISKTMTRIIVTERGYSKSLNNWWDPLVSYKVIAPGEEWSSCWEVFAEGRERLDSLAKEVHLKDFSVDFQSKEETKELIDEKKSENATKEAIVRENSSKFIDNNDGTVTFKENKLMWQKCSVGQTWTGDTCSGVAIAMTWDNAIKLSNSYAGYIDWRVPTKDELMKLIYCSHGKYVSDGICMKSDEFTAPTINTIYFPNTKSDIYWTKSDSSKYVDSAWGVYFEFGASDELIKNTEGFVRLVRKQ